ncbi:MAG TPA: Holliday junction branch migration protein RuvA [Dehalococcoidia bacterium]|nr:Holliday junction branch migration protein RuvA [Dehalococcoidia bacterium]
MSPLARLRGIVEEVGDGYLVLMVGGAGFLVQVSNRLQAAAGDPLELHTHLLMRENELSLYGFADSREQRLFQTLITVSGVGPKVALGLLSTLGADDLSLALAAGDVEALARAPGVGRKLAGRLVLELRGKLAEAPVGLASSDQEVIAALTALGYTQSEALAALSRGDASPDGDVESRVRAALQYFAADRP